MNHDRKLILFSLCLSLWLGVTGFCFAIPIRVTTDISSISGSDFELEFALDGAGTFAASVFLDNIIIKDSGGTTIVNLPFNSGVGGFTEDPPGAPVSNVGGRLRLGEHPSAFTTLVFQDFSLATVSSLSFEFEVFDFDSGALIKDTFRASLLDPATLDPLLTLSPSDSAFFKYETGVGSSFDAGITTIHPIPEPSTYLLMSLGFLGLFGLPYLRRIHCRKAKSAS
jgi:hypothetical protein